MADPGLHSKFVEMQQEEKFAAADVGDRLISNYLRSAMMDVTRITRLLALAKTDAQRKTLRAALADASTRYRSVQR